MNKKFSTKQLVFAGLFAAVISVIAQFSIPFATGVPMTLQTFAIMFCAVVLGSRTGAVACVIYVLLGAIGLPVFAEQTGGIALLFGPTSGFLLSFPIMAWIVGFFSERARFRGSLVCGIILGMSANYICGVFGYMIWARSKAGNNVSFWAGVLVCVVPYILLDAIKAVAAATLGLLVRKRLLAVMREGN